MASSTSIAGTRGRPSSARVRASSNPATQGLPDIMRMPSSMNEKPRPMTTPRSAERGTQLANCLPRPVTARTIHNSPVVSAAPTTVAALRPAASMVWLTAAAPMAFIGCTGNGVR